MPKVLGIDEAGRGPVIGPMVIVGFEIEENLIDKLVEIGVKDSKELTKEKREKIFESLQELGEVYIEIVTNKEINEWMQKGYSLTDLELLKFVKIISLSKAKKVIIDCPSSNVINFKTKLERYIRKNVEIILEHKADKKYPVVSAASIVAKVIRDREIEKIKRNIGIDFGSGYPSDPKTIESLQKYYDKLKEYVRIEWKTVERFKNKNLLDFFK